MIKYDIWYDNKNDGDDDDNNSNNLARFRKIAQRSTHSTDAWSV